MERRTRNLGYLFEKQNKRTKERIRNMENSTQNIYTVYSGRYEYINGIKSEGVLHGWKF